MRRPPTRHHRHRRRCAATRGRATGRSDVPLVQLDVGLAIASPYRVEKVDVRSRQLSHGIIPTPGYPVRHHDRSDTPAGSAPPPATTASPCPLRQARFRADTPDHRCDPSSGGAAHRLRRPRRAGTNRRRPRRRRLRPALRDPDRGDPGGDARPRRLRAGAHRIRQDPRLRRTDARPHPRRGRAGPTSRPGARADDESWRSRSPRCSNRSPPTPGSASSPSTAGPAGTTRSTCWPRGSRSSSPPPCDSST